MSGVNEIRSTFLDYFAKNGHTAVASSPLVPRNDPTLMFTNAGMVQFKNVFTGLEKRPYSRAVTLAEMRARRRQAQRPRQCRLHRAPPHLLRDARQFLVRRLFQGARDRAAPGTWSPRNSALPKDKLTVTVYIDDDRRSTCGRRSPACPSSASSASPAPTISGRWATPAPAVRARKSSTTTVRHIPGGPPGSPDADGDRFIEIWNLVFMQFEQLPGGKRVDLPKPSIDTGMGLERIAAVLQGTHDNYEIDLFGAIITHGRRSHRRRCRRAAGGLAPRHRRSPARDLVPDRRRRAALERGPRLRAPPHHAARHAPRRAAGRARAADVAAGADAGARDGPGLSRAAARRGADHRDAPARRDPLPQDAGARARHPGRGDARSAQGRQLQGRDRLHALRHLRLPARSHPGRAEAARHHRRPRRASMPRWSSSARRRAPPGPAPARPRPRRSGSACARRSAQPSSSATRPRPPKAWSRRWCATASEVDALEAGESGAVVLNQTPFYGEFGGQVGDTGLMTGEGVRFRVTDTQKKAGDVFVHSGTRRGGHAARPARRSRSTSITRGAAPSASNHSATHLLHEALRQVLGDHVAQKGSLVAPDRLRFDFSHPKPITRARARAGRGHRQRRRAAEFAGDDAADGGRRADRVRRARAVRREDTATRCASSRWARAAATRSAGRSSCAAAPMCAAPATSG